MKYYSVCDSLNAKVSKYEFTVEEVKGELMGVAVLTLNNVLTDKELDLIKSEVTGQASDGFGEGFEQREIQTDDKANIGLFGGFGSFPITLRADAAGKGEVYWK